MRRRAGIVLALLLVLTGCTPAEPAGPAAEPARADVTRISGQASMLKDLIAQFSLE